MSGEILIRGIVSLILSLIFVYGIFLRYDDDTKSESTGDKQQKYLPFIAGNLLPACIISVAIFGLFIKGSQEIAKLVVSVCFNVFLQISFYYIILIVIIPFFRKRISARTCAVLWTIPNCLYIAFYDYMNVREPLFVVRAPKNIVWMIFGIWLVGFLAVLFRNMISHLVFRSNLLKNAKEVTNSEILELWNKELEDANMMYKKYRVLVSQNARTPLSIGLFRRKICVVLPEKTYSTEELKLIFRHEMIHIGREDSWSKFFLLFCTAMCWFNPLMWIAMRKSAEDLELSCDETVLLGADDKTRRQYAELILHTAGDERGFTTCLSASASTMKYRLNNIMKTKTRDSGMFVVGVALFALFMSYGYVALAYGGATGKEIIYRSEDTSMFEIDELYIATKEDDYASKHIYECVDEEAFHEYFSKLKMENLTGNYSFSDSDKELSISLDTPKGRVYVSVYDHVIELIPIYEEDVQTYRYYLPEGVDWEYLEKLVIAYPALNVEFAGENAFYQGEHLITASVRTIKKHENGESCIAYESEVQEENANGLYGVHSYDKAILNFSHELVSACVVEIKSWDGVVKETVSLDAQKDIFEIPLADYPAHYHIYANFLGDDKAIYEVEFQFNVGEIGT